MEFFEAIKPALLSLLATVLTVVFSYIGLETKKLYKRYCDTQEKRDIADTTVRYIEQVYKDLDGQDKLNKAINHASHILSDKGIDVSGDELRALLEAAVHAMNQEKSKVDAGTTV